MPKPALATTPYIRQYYVSDMAITKYREHLTNQTGRCPMLDEEIGNQLDRAVSEVTKRSPNLTVQYMHEGTLQFATDLSAFLKFSAVAVVSATIMETSEKEANLPKYAIITVKTRDFFVKKCAQAELVRKEPSVPADTSKMPAILPPVLGKPRETMLITYTDKVNKQHTEERDADEIKDRLNHLVDDGIAMATIRVWKQLKTKVRLEFDA